MPLRRFHRKRPNENPLLKLRKKREKTAHRSGRGLCLGFIRNRPSEAIIESNSHSVQMPSQVFRGHLMPPELFSASNPQQTAASLRLDSWKQIAAYLCRGERTVKRWETERGLPIHRLPGGGRGSVYAFTAELDEWLISARALEMEVVDEEDAAGETQTDAAPPGEVLPDLLPVSGEAAVAESSSGKARSGFRRIRVSLLVGALAVLAGAAIFFVLRGGGRIVLFRYSKPAKPVAMPSDAEKQVAHELYLRGRFEWNQRTSESLNRALDDFTQAIVHDPTNAQNYVGLADTYNLLREFSLMPQSEAFSRSVAASRQAVELDDSLAEAHRSLAFDEVWGNGDFDTGLREFERAIALNPRDPIAHLWFANAFGGPGWNSLCLREIDLAQELDPSSPAIVADKGALLFGAGEREAGLEAERQVVRLEPQFLSPHRYLVGMAWDLRDYPSYLRETEEVAELSHESNLREITAAARAGFRRNGERGLLEDLYAAQKRLYAAGSLPGVLLAKTAMRLGRKDEALQWLRRDDEQHRPEFIYIREDPDLLPLHDDPVFRELRSKIHAPRPEEAAAAERALEISESGMQVAAKLR